MSWAIPLILWQILRRTQRQMAIQFQISLPHKQTATPSLQTGSVSKADLAAIVGDAKLLNLQIADFLYLKGKSLVDLGKFEEALGSFESALEYHLRFLGATSAGEGLTLFQEGLSLFGKGRHEEALHFFDKGLALEPQNENVWGGKAICELKLGRTLDAIHSLNQVLDFADDASKLRDSVVACLAELEREANHSLNGKEDVAHDDLPVGSTIASFPKDHVYKPGDMIGQNYEVHSVLGYGGCGIVYLVYSHETRQVYALKTFLDKYMEDPQVRERFRKEAYVWIQLERHPYLVRAHLVDEISGRLYIAMDYIAPNAQGINTLEGFLERRPLTLEQSLRWAIQICYGMEYAYSKGVCAHRDLKPANIMISQEGRAKVTDFGLASIQDTSQSGIDSQLTMHLRNDAKSGKTQMGIGLGTPHYMPPEQFENAVGCDQRSDIYAMGVILFQMASGGQAPLMTFTLNDRSPAENMPLGMAMWRLNQQIPVPQLNSPFFPLISVLPAETACHALPAFHATAIGFGSFTQEFKWGSHSRAEFREP